MSSSGTWCPHFSVMPYQPFLGVVGAVVTNHISFTHLCYKVLVPENLINLCATEDFTHFSYFEDIFCQMAFKACSNYQVKLLYTFSSTEFLKGNVAGCVNFMFHSFACHSGLS